MRLLLISLLLLSPVRALALSATTTQPMDLGTYVQTATGASGVLSYNSSVSSLSGLVAESSTVPQAAIVEIERSNLLEIFVTAYVSSGGSVVLSNTPGCTITVRNFTFNPSSASMLTSPRDFNIGATVAISGGFCKEGTYTGTGTLNYGITQQSQGNSQNFQISIKLVAPLDIEGGQNMDFGTILSPSADSTVTILPSGGYTQSGTVQFRNSGLSPGEFTARGVGGRLVNITLPSSTTISDGTNEMLVDSFTSDPTGSFHFEGTGTSQTQKIRTGATLHINKNQKEGDYSGTYPVIVSY